jgi:hypothetical protein
MPPGGRTLRGASSQFCIGDNERDIRRHGNGFDQKDDETTRRRSPGGCV